MSALTGTRTLLAASLRQNRRAIAPWVLLISVLSASSIIAYRWIFPDAADRVALATALGSNPALDLIFGPARDLMTNDGFNAWRAGQLGALFAALMAILIVVRNSRADEDSGQAELIASGVIPRQARLAVPVALATLAAVALGVVCFLLTWACGGGVRATLLLSAGYTGVALVFAGVAAVTAQLGSEAHTASSLAIGTMGVLYVVRGWCDTSGARVWTQWLTPFGWLERIGPATANNAWPLLVFPGLAIGLVGLAMVLQQHRDFGLGVLAPRPGPAAAPRLGVRTLAWRLHRGTLVVWMVAFAFLGVVFGNLATSIGTVFASNPAIARVLASGATTTGQLTSAFVATILQLLGIITAIMGAQVVMRVHAEETDFRVEPLLAGPLRRTTYLASNVVIALLADAVALLLAGTVLGVVASHGAAGVNFGDVAEQAAVTIPAVWILTAISVAAVGAHPRLRLVGWLVIVATFGITLLGPTFKFPGWALDISPLHHVPMVTLPHSWTPEWVLAAIAVAILGVGFVGFRHRDVV